MTGGYYKAFQYTFFEIDQTLLDVHKLLRKSMNSMLGFELVLYTARS